MYYSVNNWIIHFPFFKFPFTVLFSFSFERLFVFSTAALLSDHLRTLCFSWVCVTTKMVNLFMSMLRFCIYFHLNDFHHSLSSFFFDSFCVYQDDFFACALALLIWLNFWFVFLFSMPVVQCLCFVETFPNGIVVKRRKSHHERQNMTTDFDYRLSLLKNNFYFFSLFFFILFRVLCVVCIWDAFDISIVFSSCFLLPNWTTIFLFFLFGTKLNTYYWILS